MLAERLRGGCDLDQEPFIVSVPEIKDRHDAQGFRAGNPIRIRTTAICI
jgi:hypothetical protein